MKKKHSIQKPLSDRITLAVNYVLLALITVIMAYPIYFVLVASVSSSKVVNSGRLLLWPEGFHLQGYIFALKDSRIWTGYGNTILYTLCGTLLGLIVSLMAGYALSVKKLPCRRLLLFFMAIPMYFGGGLIPTYLTVRDLGLLNTRAIMIILGSVSVYNIIVIRSFMMANIPSELSEAAFMDGCGHGRYFFQIVLPLSTAICAVIALWLAVGYWNSYFSALVYITDKSKKPLQLFIREILLISSDSMLAVQSNTEEANQYRQVVEVIKYALIVVATVPIMCVYPFLQKYFVKGVMVGSLKG